MPKVKLPKSIKTAVEEFVQLDEKRRDATNAANRQKTALTNEVKSYWTANSIGVGSYAVTNGLRISYETSTSEVVDPEEVLKLYEAKEITREQFLRMIKVDKAEAKNVIGGDQVADFTVSVAGKNLGLRLSTLPVEQHDDEYLMNVSAPKSRLKRRKVFGRSVKLKQESAESTPASRTRKRVKFRNSKND